jgi:hypothetical protein
MHARSWNGDGTGKHWPPVAQLIVDVGAGAQAVALLAQPHEGRLVEASALQPPPVPVDPLTATPRVALWQPALGAGIAAQAPLEGTDTVPQPAVHVLLIVTVAGPQVTPAGAPHVHVH